MPSKPAAFARTTSNRSLALAAGHYAAVVLAPPLGAAVSAAAPAIRLRLRTSGTSDILDRLDRGDLNRAPGNMKSSGERFATLPLL